LRRELSHLLLWSNPERQQRAEETAGGISDLPPQSSISQPTTDGIAQSSSPQTACDAAKDALRRDTAPVQEPRLSHLRSSRQRQQSAEEAAGCISDLLPQSSISQPTTDGIAQSSSP
jgi:hypothetical protein